MAQNKQKNWFTKVIDGIRDWFKDVFGAQDGYLSRKEEKEITKQNRQKVREFERRKRQKVDESYYLTEMKNPDNVVEFDNLHTYFFTDSGVLKAVNGVSFDIPKGVTVGIVGESGCGKSITALSLMSLVQAPQGQIVDGSIRFKSRSGKTYDVTKMPQSEMRHIRGKEISMIFQEPMTSLNPVFTIGAQIDEVSKLHLKAEIEEEVAKTNADLNQKIQAKSSSLQKVNDELAKQVRPDGTFESEDKVRELNESSKQLNDSIEDLKAQLTTFKKHVRQRSIDMLNLVGIAMADKVYDRYPHELSGGMRQRVMIAMSLACNPKLVIADEPTTALDVTIQAQILDLLRDIKHKFDGSIMLITHDLGVIAEMADFVVMMYAGKIIEVGTVEEIFDNPMHPYTIALQKSKPTITDERTERLYSIPGQVPNPVNMPKHCYFRDRCNMRRPECDGDYPALTQESPTHSICCHLYSGKSAQNTKTNRGANAKP